MLTPINQKLFELLEYDLKDERFTKDLSIVDKEQRSKATKIDIDINGLNESLSMAINKKIETLTEEKKLYGYLSEEKKLQCIINKINEKPFVELEQERKTFEEKLEKVTGHQEKIKQEKGTVVYTSNQTFNTETYQNEKLILSRINVAENNRLIGNINDSILAAEKRVNILREESRKLKNHLSQNLEVIEQKIKELKPMLPPTPKEERRKSWEIKKAFQSNEYKNGMSIYNQSVKLIKDYQNNLIDYGKICHQMHDLEQQIYGKRKEIKDKPSYIKSSKTFKRLNYKEGFAVKALKNSYKKFYPNEVSSVISTIKDLADTANVKLHLRNEQEMSQALNNLLPAVRRKGEINKQNPNLGNIVEQARKNAESMRNSSVQKSPHQVR